MKKHNYFIGWITLIFLLTIFFINFFSPTLTFSNQENRILASKPKLDFDSLLDGSYFSSYSKYLEDQFWNRTMWKSFKTSFEKKIGLKKIDHLYFGKDGRLIEEAIVPSDDFLTRRINNLTKFLDYYKDLNTEFVLVPNKIGIYNEEIGVENKQKEIYHNFIKNFDPELFKVNCFDILNSHKEENIFYNTDHHYTSLAARYISESLYDKKEVTYDKYIVNDHFMGTSANKIAYYDKADIFELYVPKVDVSYYLTYSNEEKEYTSLYDKSKQYSYNPYEIFFGGNKSIIDIRTNSKKEEKLLILKDSYANSFIPFILSDYREIIVVDPRYYYDDINSLIEDKQITDILFFYSMNTFFEDTSLDDMIENTEK